MLLNFLKTAKETLAVCQKYQFEYYWLRNILNAWYCGPEIFYSIVWGHPVIFEGYMFPTKPHGIPISPRYYTVLGNNYINLSTFQSYVRKTLQSRASGRVTEFGNHIFPPPYWQDGGWLALAMQNWYLSTKKQKKLGLSCAKPRKA